jgi:TRAP-type C4-dicarboxylate transport system permease small subunit
MLARYIQAMDVLNRACVIIAGSCLVLITLIVPWGVFTRYVLNSAASWPEPMAVLLMIVMSFFSSIVCYREYLHIGVGLLPTFLIGAARTALGVVIELCMGATTLFMLWFGIKLCQTTWHQGLAEFPMVSAGLSYLPIPIAGTITTLFIIERFFTSQFFKELSVEETAAISTE